MISKPVKLVPVKSGYSPTSGREYFEQVLVYDGEYPASMVHIDSFFWTKEKDDIYRKLERGETVECFMMFSMYSACNAI